MNIAKLKKLQQDLNFRSGPHMFLSEARALLDALLDEPEAEAPQGDSWIRPCPGCGEPFDLRGGHRNLQPIGPACERCCEINRQSYQVTRRFEGATSDD